MRTITNQHQDRHEENRQLPVNLSCARATGATSRARPVCSGATAVTWMQSCEAVQPFIFSMSTCPSPGADFSAYATQEPSPRKSNQTPPNQAAYEYLQNSIFWFIRTLGSTLRSMR